MELAILNHRLCKEIDLITDGNLTLIILEYLERNLWECNFIKLENITEWRRYHTWADFIAKYDNNLQLISFCWSVNEPKFQFKPVNNNTNELLEIEENAVNTAINIQNSESDISDAEGDDNEESDEEFKNFIFNDVESENEGDEGENEETMERCNGDVLFLYFSENCQINISVTKEEQTIGIQYLEKYLNGFVRLIDVSSNSTNKRKFENLELNF